MGTKNNPGQFDCYANAEPNEPMFILLGRDRHAAVLVRLWALLRHRDGEDEAMVSEALACAKTMEAFAKQRGKELTEPQQILFEKLLTLATEGMDQHPYGYDYSCDCLTCRSYD